LASYSQFIWFTSCTKTLVWKIVITFM